MQASQSTPQFSSLITNLLELTTSSFHTLLAKKAWSSHNNNSILSVIQRDLHKLFYSKKIYNSSNSKCLQKINQCFEMAGIPSLTNKDLTDLSTFLYHTISNKNNNRHNYNHNHNNNHNNNNNSHNNMFSTVTVSTIVSQCLHMTNSRSYSTASGNKPRISEVKAFDFKLKKLEELANSNPHDDSIQTEYLNAVLPIDPHYVIRRCDTGYYSLSDNTRSIYNEACRITNTEHTNKTNTQHSNNRNPLLMQQTQTEPLVVKVLPRKFKFWREAIKILGYLFVVSLVLHTIDTSVKAGLPNLKKSGFQQDLGDKKYRFSDVQGVEEAKNDLQEVVEFLKNPEKFQRLGAKMPKGVLLIGQPGTGKTLLARAVAGEAEVPFYFTSGSEFDEMYVGVGAARLRQLFQTAKSNKPCVVFIDELDAVGGARIATDVHPYARMTLNQLLVELDGYRENEEVVVIGATNFPEALDKALIRPGRFDTRVYVPIPDVKARHEILKLHLSKVKSDPKLDIEILARATIGLTGADLANIVNQAAIHGSVTGNDYVTLYDLEFARDKMLLGPERRSAVISQKNKELVAYHEAGHAIVALYTEDALPIHKATIIPRGSALGLVAQLPEKDELSWSKQQLTAKLDVSMGGRAAEEIIFGVKKVTTGASSDMDNATTLANAMVTKYGMSDLVGPIFISERTTISSDLRKIIDTEVQRLVKEAIGRAHSLLVNHSKEHHFLAQALLKYETLDLTEIKQVIKGQKLDKNL